jgi:hypothetical protein
MTQVQPNFTPSPTDSASAKPTPVAQKTVENVGKTVILKNFIGFILTEVLSGLDSFKGVNIHKDTNVQKAIEKVGSKPEITRFKGLGEISPEEFGKFIGEVFH